MTTRRLLPGHLPRKAPPLSPVHLRVRPWAYPLACALPFALAFAIAGPARSLEAAPVEDLGGRRSGEPLAPLPPAPDLPPAKVALGKRLYHDARLSKDGSVSCATCHPVAAGGTVQGVRYSIGVAGAEHRPTWNVPTIYNAAYNFTQTWAGGDSLERVIDRPLLGAKLMANGTWKPIMAVIGGDAEYVRAFEDAYGEVSEPAVRDALAAYMRFLVPRGAAFDRYLRGDDQAISYEAKLGYERFKSYGCASCHQGQNVGGNMYARLGVMGDYFQDRGGPITDNDKGRFMVTNRDLDMFVFKVPSLRNVEVTPPYFHDGSEPSLEEAVKKMAKYQLGRRLSDDDVRYIVEFLKTLTGTVPKDALVTP